MDFKKLIFDLGENMREGEKGNILATHEEYSHLILQIVF
jgi:hypothetical protein